MKKPTMYRVIFVMDGRLQAGQWWPIHDDYSSATHLAAFMAAGEFYDIELQ